MTENVTPELVERMIEVLRGYVAGSCATAYGPNENRSVYAEAAAIVAELPAPVDPDLVEARKAAADYMTANNPDIGEAWQAAMMSGQMDDGNMVGIALAAIKRTLATQVDR